MKAWVVAFALGMIGIIALDELLDIPPWATCGASFIWGWQVARHFTLRRHR